MKSVLAILALVLAGVAIPLPGATAEDAPKAAPPQGEVLWERYCAACHPRQPPPTQAPPALGIVMHYASAHRDREAFARAVARWVASPAKERSLLPPHATERFGPMPPLPYPEAELLEIGRWLWDSFAGQRPGSAH
jgi:mono/diheme cytochrome c family protein